MIKFGSKVKFIFASNYKRIFASKEKIIKVASKVKFIFATKDNRIFASKDRPRATHSDDMYVSVLDVV